jgi:hypothetical protein
MIKSEMTLFCRSSAVVLSLMVMPFAAGAAPSPGPAIGVGGEIPMVDSINALPASIDPATRARLTPILERARDRGLPVNALVATAAHGVLRGAPSSRIVSAVEALEERLTTAQLALAPAQTADVIAGADVLAIGVKANVLRTIRRYQPKQSVAVPLAVLAALISKKVPQPRAVEIVYKLLERGASSQQLLALQKGVNDDILAGESASHALDERAATVFAALGHRPSTTTGSTATALAPGGLELSNGGKKK